MVEVINPVPPEVKPNKEVFNASHMHPMTARMLLGTVVDARYLDLDLPEDLKVDKEQVKGKIKENSEDGRGCGLINKASLDSRKRYYENENITAGKQYEHWEKAWKGWVEKQIDLRENAREEVDKRKAILEKIKMISPNGEIKLDDFYKTYFKGDTNGKGLKAFVNDLLGGLKMEVLDSLLKEEFVKELFINFGTKVDGMGIILKEFIMVRGMLSHSKNDDVFMENVAKEAIEKAKGGLGEGESKAMKRLYRIAMKGNIEQSSEQNEAGSDYYEEGEGEDEEQPICMMAQALVKNDMRSQGLFAQELSARLGDMDLKGRISRMNDCGLHLLSVVIPPIQEALRARMNNESGWQEKWEDMMKKVLDGLTIAYSGDQDLANRDLYDDFLATIANEFAYSLIHLPLNMKSDGDRLDFLNFLHKNGIKLGHGDGVHFSAFVPVGDSEWESYGSLESDMRKKRTSEDIFNLRMSQSGVVLGRDEDGKIKSGRAEASPLMFFVKKGSDQEGMLMSTLANLS